MTWASASRGATHAKSGSWWRGEGRLPLDVAACVGLAPSRRRWRGLSRRRGGAAAGAPRAPASHRQRRVEAACRQHADLVERTFAPSSHRSARRCPHAAPPARARERPPRTALHRTSGAPRCVCSAARLWPVAACTSSARNSRCGSLGRSRAARWRGSRAASAACSSAGGRPSAQARRLARTSVGTDGILDRPLRQRLEVEPRAADHNRYQPGRLRRGEGPGDRLQPAA